MAQGDVVTLSDACMGPAPDGAAPAAELFGPFGADQEPSADDGPRLTPSTLRAPAMPLPTLVIAREHFAGLAETGGARRGAARGGAARGGSWCARASRGSTRVACGLTCSRARGLHSAPTPRAAAAATWRICRRVQ